MQRLHPFEFRLMRNTSRLLAPVMPHLRGTDRPKVVHPDLCAYTCAREHRVPLSVFLMVSGGKDSMALLHGVHAFAHSPLFPERDQVLFYVLHCDHLTRGGASTRDAEFVTSIAVECGFPIVRTAWTERGGLQDAASEPGGSFQTMASSWRRTVRSRIREHWGPSCLFVTAHHAGDRAESILLNLVRGASVAGLTGMTAWHHEERIIRPLLGMPNGATKAYLDDRDLSFREDASNLDTRYRRNAIRHTVMPALRQLNPDVEAALNRLGDSVAGFGPYPQSGSPVTGDGGLHASDLGLGQLADSIRKHHPAYLRHLTRAQLTNLAHHADLSHRDGGLRSVELSGGWRATCRSGHIQLVPPG